MSEKAAECWLGSCGSLVSFGQHPDGFPSLALSLDTGCPEFFKDYGYVCLT